MHERQYNSSIERLRSPERVQRLEVERVVALCLETEAIGSVLDIGAGSGLFSEAFARRKLDVSGVDINPEMVAAAHQFVPQGDFRESTAESLPFPDASFDLVFMGLLLHESDEPLKALQEACRVARKLVCISEWPYRETEFGPPLSDRLSPAQVEKMSLQAGFTRFESIPLKNVVFYRLRI
jgi:ubiquinone/menaquinone biosynthesis C-methylase UbiE